MRIIDGVIQPPEKLDYRFLNQSLIRSDTPIRIVGSSAEVTAGYATHVIGDFWDTPPSAGTTLIFKASGSDIALDQNEDINANGMYVASETPNAVLDTDTYTITFSGNNITADIFVSDVNNVLVTGSNCKITVNGGEVEILNDINTGVPKSFTLNKNISTNTAVKVIDNSGAKITNDLPLADVYGDAVAFEPGATEYIYSCFDSNSNKIIVAYRDFDNSSYGTGVVLSINDKTLTAGTPNLFEGGSTIDVSCCFDNYSNRVIVAYRDVTNSNRGTAVVGTVIGNTITFGTPVVFNAAITYYTHCCFDSNSNKFVVAYRDEGNSSYGTAIVGEVTGDTISFGSETVFEQAQSDYISCAFDSNSNKVVISYSDVGGSSYGTSIVGTITGNSITFGTPNIFESVSSSYISSCFDSTNNKIVISYNNTTNGTAVVGEVSGDSITFGTPVPFASAITVFSNGCQHLPDEDKILIAYQDFTNSNDGVAIIGTISGNTITFGSPDIFNTNVLYVSVGCKDSNNNAIITYRDQNNSNKGTAISYKRQVTDANYKAVVGVLGETGTTGETKKTYSLGDTVTTFSGQTPGATAYLHENGLINETISEYPIGRFISDTELYVTKDP